MINTLGVPGKGLLQGLFLSSCVYEVLYGASERVFVKVHLVEGVKGLIPLTQVRLIWTAVYSVFWQSVSVDIVLCSFYNIINRFSFHSHSRTSRSLFEEAVCTGSRSYSPNSSAQLNYWF